MTREEEDEKEFEEIWEADEMEYGEKFTFYPIIKRLARRYFLESRRTLRKSIETKIQKLGEDEDIDPRTAERIWDLIKEC